MSRLPLGPLGGDNLGDYLREQRQSAKLSLRQLSELAGVSNPYLSQIERGLKKPSAEILQQLAKGLEVSAESLYVRAGILDERHGHPAEVPDTRAAIGADPRLSDRQKSALVDIYDSFVGGDPAPAGRATSAAKPGTGRQTPHAPRSPKASPAHNKTQSTSKRTTTKSTPLTQGD